MNWAIYGMVYLGSALMVYNVYSYIRYARRVQQKGSWERERFLLTVPIVLLVLFLLGYLAVGIFGKPDLIVSGILFGGSVFVFIIFLLLQRITARIQTNEQLEAKLMATTESNLLKTSFLSTMSHEMRTPMNAIIGLDAIALRNPALSAQTRDQLEKIGDNARHLLGMIDDILDMSHIESGVAAPKSEPFCLSQALEPVDKLIREQCDAAGIRYVRRVEGAPDDWYAGDAALLRRALISILENAVKFTPRGGAVTFVTEQLPGDGDRRTLRFTVSDTGIGIDPAFLPRLFDPFSREDSSTTSRYGGSGLGLAIAYRIARLMGGDIAVKSEMDAGSVFTVTVELGAVERPMPACDAPAGSIWSDVSLEGRSVLIAEDIDMNAEIIADLMDMEGVRSDRAENGRIAVERFAESPVNGYDAILMDLRMPVMDGLDAARAIRDMDRADAAAVPIVALTANAFDEDRLHALEAGMNDYLSKPVDADKLCDTLRHLIALREAKQ